MPLLRTNETSLYYEDSGPGSSGETIVFSHGLLWSTALFAKQIAALRARYRCIAWDHRGQGESASDHRHTIGIELVSQDAVCLLEDLGVKKAHFVGLSMGGFVGMRIAARRPDLVDKLILIETSADPEPLESVGKYRLLSGLARVFGPKVAAKKVAPIMLGKTILTDPSRKGEVERYTDIMCGRRDIWKAVNGVIDRAGISRAELSRVQSPTLVAVGDEDVATPIVRSQRIVSGISGAKLVTIPRAGHSSPVEEPQRVTKIIEQFLADNTIAA